MKLSDYKQDFYDYSGRASDVARKACFAGIAIIWIFRVEAESCLSLPQPLKLPLLFFALALAFDLLHYIVGALTWGAFHLYHEHKLDDVQDDPAMAHSWWLSLPINLLFIFKLAFALVGYACLSAYLLGVLS